MKRIKEAKYKEKTRAHTTIQLPDNLIKFSFKYLHICEKYPLKKDNAYIACLFERLKDVSHILINDFITNNSKGLRSHSHNWPDTTEPDGYSNLNEHLRHSQPWQFSLSSNEHGRVHGILLDEVFYVIWLDPDHNLYN